MEPEGGGNNQLITKVVTRFNVMGIIRTHSVLRSVECFHRLVECWWWPGWCSWWTSVLSAYHQQFDEELVVAGRPRKLPVEMHWNTQKITRSNSWWKYDDGAGNGSETLSLTVSLALICWNKNLLVQTQTGQSDRPRSAPGCTGSPQSSVQKGNAG